MRDDWLDWEVAKVKHDCTFAKGTALGCEVKKGEASVTRIAEKDSSGDESAGCGMESPRWDLAACMDLDLDSDSEYGGMDSGVAVGA